MDGLGNQSPLLAVLPRLMCRKSSASSFSIEPVHTLRAPDYRHGAIERWRHDDRPCATLIEGLTPPVERSITVSAPYFTARRSFGSTSSSRSESVGGKRRMFLAIPLHLDAIADRHQAASFGVELILARDDSCGPGPPPPSPVDSG